MTNALPYLAATVCVALLWIAGLLRLDVFTPDDVRALHRLAGLRGYARRRPRLEHAVASLPLVGRVQRELDLERLLAVAGRDETAAGFLARSLAYGLLVFALLLALDATARAVSLDWPLAPWVAPLAGAAVALAAIARLKAQARRAQERSICTLEDMMMSLAIIMDSRGISVGDAVRMLARCSLDGALERLVDRGGWRRLIGPPPRSTQELYRRLGAAYGIPLFSEMADAQTAAHLGVPEREVYTRLAQAVYRERLTRARARAARARVLVTLPVAAMLIPLLLLIGVPALHSITAGLQGG